MSIPGDGVFRQTFLKQLATHGTQCHAGGKYRLTLIHEEKNEGYTLFRFAELFEINPGDKIRRLDVSRELEVIDLNPVARAGIFVYFEVMAS